MTLFSQVRGVPVVTLGEATELGVVKSLTIDVASGLVSSGTTALVVRTG